MFFCLLFVRLRSSFLFLICWGYLSWKGIKNFCQMRWQDYVVGWLSFHMLNQPSHRRINPTWCWCIISFLHIATFSLLIKKSLYIFGHVACRILVPQPGIEALSLAVEYGVLTTGPLGKSLACCYFDEDLCACVPEGYWCVRVCVSVCVCVYTLSCSVVSNSLRPHGL